ncbi:hypothetical protein JAAARDRAFT_50030 [Jaapia argillacea MUCL 33604]|uniref:Zn(2)-C6 fungal-type domain-containing protein n=1 Tax=Jaapia argillacea MUCL 33604 TaxID=933084 RepID=A0A067PDR9_9AGAM|nr:hypothetical protein JAAARDRAFT_50030 [Jaapia argillacea MUCL 33604]
MQSQVMVPMEQKTVVSVIRMFEQQTNNHEKELEDKKLELAVANSENRDLRDERDALTASLNDLRRSENVQTLIADLAQAREENERQKIASNAHRSTLTADLAQTRQEIKKLKITVRDSEKALKKERDIQVKSSEQLRARDTEIQDLKRRIADLEKCNDNQKVELAQERETINRLIAENKALKVTRQASDTIQASNYLNQLRVICRIWTVAVPIREHMVTIIVRRNPGMGPEHNPPAPADLPVIILSTRVTSRRNRGPEERNCKPCTIAKTKCSLDRPICARCQSMPDKVTCQWFTKDDPPPKRKKPRTAYYPCFLLVPVFYSIDLMYQPMLFCTIETLAFLYRAPEPQITKLRVLSQSRDRSLDDLLVRQFVFRSQMCPLHDHPYRCPRAHFPLRASASWIKIGLNERMASLNINVPPEVVGRMLSRQYEDIKGLEREIAEAKLVIGTQKVQIDDLNRRLAEEQAERKRLEEQLASLQKSHSIKQEDAESERRIASTDLARLMAAETSLTTQLAEKLAATRAAEQELVVAREKHRVDYTAWQVKYDALHQSHEELKVSLSNDNSNRLEDLGR